MEAYWTPCAHLEAKSTGTVFRARKKCGRIVAFAMSMAEKFPYVVIRRKKWIHAIRRDEGVYFQIKPTTKVCSRHFRENDFIKTLAGRRDLRADAVPSVFAWIRTSPRKRKPPTVRENIAETSRNILEENEREEEPNYSEILVNEG